MESIIERYGEVQHRFEELDGYALEGRAREVLAGLSFRQEMMDGDVGALSDYEGTMLFVTHDRHFLAALSNRVLELRPEGVHQYGGGYTEYVARTGHEAPGLDR